MQTLHVVPHKVEAGKLTTKLARLDHQRGLLARQLTMWTEKQELTKRRIGLVEKQMAEIARLTRPFNGASRSERSRKRMKADEGAATVSRKEMHLEY